MNFNLNKYIRPNESIRQAYHGYVISSPHTRDVIYEPVVGYMPHEGNFLFSRFTTFPDALCCNE